jgi:hypothetical protein
MIEFLLRLEQITVFSKRRMPQTFSVTFYVRGLSNFSHMRAVLVKQSIVLAGHKLFSKALK